MDPIADFLTQIRNAYLAKKLTLSTPKSNFKLELAKLLSDQGYLGGVEIEGDVPKQKLNLTLVYRNKLPMITHIKRISKPSVRHYAKADALPRALSGRGLTVVSTSKGLMTDRKARKASIGGEIICQVW